MLRKSEMGGVTQEGDTFPPQRLFEPLYRDKADSNVGLRDSWLLERSGSEPKNRSASESQTRRYALRVGVSAVSGSTSACDARHQDLFAIGKPQAKVRRQREHTLGR